MSLNSLDSKISPHSLHSTYSESSSRETICTCGCLHGWGGAFCLAGCAGWLGVIGFREGRVSRGETHFCKFAVFCDGWPGKSSPHSEHPGEYLADALNSFSRRAKKAVREEVPPKPLNPISLRLSRHFLPLPACPCQKERSATRIKATERVVVLSDSISRQLQCSN